jgi:hypothetical protein
VHLLAADHYSGRVGTAQPGMADFLHNHISPTESRFAAYLNRLLQQSLPEAAVHSGSYLYGQRALFFKQWGGAALSRTDVG